MKIEDELLSVANAHRYLGDPWWDIYLRKNFEVWEKHFGRAVVEKVRARLKAVTTADQS